jgi:hypothetical protein
MKNNYKMYVSLALYAILGLAIGYAVARGVIYAHDKYVNYKAKSAIETNTATDTVKTFEGEVSSNFEGPNTVKYAFVYDGAYTATSTKPKYVFIKEGTTTIATIYMSYEGGRGYTGKDYVNQVIKKVVAGISAPVDTTDDYGTWTKASSASTDWNILSAGEYLAVIESSKLNTSKIVSILETLSFVKVENK